MISVVIPMYNEEKIIADTAEKTRDYLERAFPGNYELIFVDDGSADNCRSIAEKFASDYVKAISYTPNKGKGNAIRTGMLAAKGELIFFTDCDLAYGLDILGEGARLLGTDASASVVIGSRRKHKEGYEGYPLLRKIFSFGFVFAIKLLCGFKYSDSQSGIKGFKRETAREIFTRCQAERWSFDLELLMIADKLGYKVIEMPVKIINHRESKVNLIKDSINMFRDVFKIKARLKKMS